MMGHAAGLEITEGKYPMQRTDIRTFNISENSYGNTLEDIWQREVPSCLIIRMVKSEAYSGVFDLNPFRFEHFNVASVGFYVNGEPTPRPAFSLDVDNGDYLQGLLSLYRVSGKLMENTDIGITRELYREGYNLLGFDVDPMTSADFRYLGMPKNGHTKLNIRFKSHLEDPVTLILYVTFPETMEIDEARNVKLVDKEKLQMKRRSG